MKIKQRQSKVQMRKKLE